MRKIRLEVERMVAGHEPGQSTTDCNCPGPSARVGSGSASLWGSYADRADMLRTRAQMLTGEDKVLVEMYLEGSSVGEMACLAGVNAETISRRVCKLMRRLLRSEYIMCFRNRRYLSRAEQAIAKDYFIDGRSQRSIALSRDVSLYKVRKALRRMRMLMNREKKGK